MKASVTLLPLLLLSLAVDLLPASRPPSASRIRTLKNRKHAVGSVDPFSKIEAESYNYQTGIAVQSCSDTDGGYDIYDLNVGDVVGYLNTDFSHGNATRIQFRVVAEFPVGHTATIDVSTDSYVATVNVTDTAGVWVTFETDLVGAAPSDVQDLYLTFRISDSENDYWAINWFQFLQN